MAAEAREISAPTYIGDGDLGNTGGGTYTNPGNGSVNPTIQDYENIFGPAARDVKLDLQRNKRHARWHLPDALRGSNPWLTDRIDGLITDTTGSPFTTKILPYKFIENVDQKIKWNAWSFDEGLASRVPYESAARTLTQTKRSYAGYTVRQGLAITMEHNFMMSDKGRENFRHQLQQIVGSIQYTNDIDVHIALITAPSYAKERAEKYYTQSKTNHQVVREYIDLFGFTSKNPNALDIMIEEGRSLLRSWGAKEPDFMLTNSKLTFQMTMIPEKTSYVTHGTDGQRRLMDGPNIASYRGLNIINTRSFSLEDGAPPRDVLRRRVRVAEYHRIPWEEGNEERSWSFYDESKDSWQKYSFNDLFAMSLLDEAEMTYWATLAAAQKKEHLVKWKPEIVMVRPNIEHNMLGIIMGRGGIEDLGATLWGQTELSVYDDSMHGIWGMSYKYNERAIVFNQKNLIRLWDVAYDGYNGGKDTRHLKWDNEDHLAAFGEDTYAVNKPYEGVSMMVMSFPIHVDGHYRQDLPVNAPLHGDPMVSWPSPVIFHHEFDDAGAQVPLAVDAEHTHRINKAAFQVMHLPQYTQRYGEYVQKMPDFSRCHNVKSAGTASEENETSCNSLAFQGTHRIHDHANPMHLCEVTGNGHHGADFVGAASVRAGKGVRMAPQASVNMMHQI
jgi:hypothetical protein